MATRETFRPYRPRKQPKQARSLELFDAILQGAARVFDREGLEATTNRIAQEAGVSIGSLYQYFPNKESLLVSLAERHVDAVSALIREAITSTKELATLREFIAAMVGGVLREHQARPHLRALLRAVGPQEPELSARFDQCVLEAELAIVARLRRQYPDLSNPELRARLVTTAVDGLIHAERALDFTPEAQREVVALCVSYLEH